MRPKEVDYLIDYYGPREHQFVYAYTKHLPNLGARSTQRAEGLHPVMKQLTTKHTAIQDSVAKIAIEVKNIFAERVQEVDRQRHKLPRLMDRNVFASIGNYITHEAINILIREWNSTMQLALKVKSEELDAPEGEKCLMDCILPMQYRLPCKCWLYRCVELSVPIPISLIHPRWLLDGPDYVGAWQMSFDLG